MKLNGKHPAPPANLHGSCTSNCKSGLSPSLRAAQGYWCQLLLSRVNRDPGAGDLAALAVRIHGLAGMHIAQGCFTCPALPPCLCLWLPRSLPLPPSPSSARDSDPKLRPENTTSPSLKTSRPRESKREISQSPPGEVDVMPHAWEGLSSAMISPFSPKCGQLRSLMLGESWSQQV